jgi:hypothetical protein
MALFSKETNEAAENFLTTIHDTLSDSYNLFWYHLAVWATLLVGTPFLVSLATIGINTWWTQYVAQNPHVLIEHTLQYWMYIGSLTILNIATVLQTLLVFGMLYVIGFRKTKIYKRPTSHSLNINPLCPICNSNTYVIRKGLRNGNRRYLCKGCNKYFTK